MKRVVMFGGCGHRPAEALNYFLVKHPEFELLGISPVVDRLNNSLLYCTMEVPDNVSGLSEKQLAYFGFEADGNVTAQNQEEED